MGLGKIYMLSGKIGNGLGFVKKDLPVVEKGDQSNCPWAQFGSLPTPT